MTSPTNRTAYTIAQASSRVGRDQRTVKRWLAAGLPHLKIGSHVYIGHKELMMWWRTQMENNPARTRRTD